MKRRDLLNAGTVVLLIGAHQIAHGASVVAVRIWPARDYTRVTIESDGALVARHLVAYIPDSFVTKTFSVPPASATTRSVFESKAMSVGS